MAVRISQYDPAMTAQVAAFNERLRAGGEPTRLPASPVSKWLPKLPGQRLFEEYYVAQDDNQAVRGGYILKHQDFWIAGETVSIADLRLPVSEGAVSPQYRHLAALLVRDAQQRQPLLFGFGMGGWQEPAARLFRAAGWEVFAVPFFFRVVHPFAFLRNIAYLRRKAAWRWACDLLAFSGLGWLGIKGTQAARDWLVRPAPPPDVQAVAEFADWADELWQQHRHHYGMTAVRDGSVLRRLYPSDDGRFIRLKLSEGSKPLGWAVLLSTQLSRHGHFGNMRLGTIVDCFAAPADAAKVIAAARGVLEQQGTDLIVSNQSHAAWCCGLRASGFLAGPSNCLFASAPALTQRLRAADIHPQHMHLNRGDGDGPINL